MDGRDKPGHDGKVSSFTPIGEKLQETERTG
jgi:hypothetical protein